MVNAFLAKKRLSAGVLKYSNEDQIKELLDKMSSLEDEESLLDFEIENIEDEVKAEFTDYLDSLEWYEAYEDEERAIEENIEEEKEGLESAVEEKKEELESELEDVDHIEEKYAEKLESLEEEYERKAEELEEWKAREEEKIEIEEKNETTMWVFNKKAKIQEIEVSLEKDIAVLEEKEEKEKALAKVRIEKEKEEQGKKFTEMVSSFLEKRRMRLEKVKEEIDSIYYKIKTLEGEDGY